MLVMSWNVKNFRSAEEVFDPWQQGLLLRALYPSAALLPVVDVFAIIEVYNRRYNTPVGQPLPPDSVGTRAVTLLWKELTSRNNDNCKWRLVPPLSLGIGGRSEGVAIFYNDATVEFLGPNGWYGASKVYDPHSKTQNYPPPWDKCFPKEPYYCSRVQFYDGGKEVTFPDDGHRRPCLARFRARKPGVKARLVDVILLHTSPPFHMDPENPANPALQACQYLQKIQEVANPTHDNVDATVIMGDFNVNAAKANQWKAAFDGITQKGYKSVAPAAGGAQKAQPSTLKEKKDLIVLPPNPIPEGAVDEYYWDKFAIDNAFWAPAGVSATGRVVDLTAAFPKPIWSTSVMFESMAEILALWPPIVQYNTFTAMRNEYQNPSVSDHTPVYISLS